MTIKQQKKKNNKINHAILQKLEVKGGIDAQYSNETPFTSAE